jgi:hypothetical protein
MLGNNDELHRQIAAQNVYKMLAQANQDKPRVEASGAGTCWVCQSEYEISLKTFYAPYALYCPFCGISLLQMARVSDP